MSNLVGRITEPHIIAKMMEKSCFQGGKQPFSTDFHKKLSFFGISTILLYIYISIKDMS
jgi:hypothetical protein